MENVYRYIVIGAILLGLIANAVAILSVKHDVKHMARSIESLQHNIWVVAGDMRQQYSTLDASIKDQLGEHDRLITQLESMVNVWLDK